MIEYVKQKHSAIEVKDVGCGCGKSTQSGKGRGGSVASTAIKTKMSDSEFVRARYTGRKGNHHIVGAYQFDQNPGLPSRKVDRNKWVLYYGYKAEGYETLVHKEDVRLMVGKWQIVPIVEMPETKKEPIPEPELIEESVDTIQASRDRLNAILSEDFDLRSLPGITPAIADRMAKEGIDTPDRIREVGLEGLQEIRGIAKTRARAILRALD